MTVEQRISDIVGEMTGNRVEVLTFDEELIRVMIAAGDPLLDSLRVDAVTVAGPDLATWLRRAVA